MATNRPNQPLSATDIAAKQTAIQLQPPPPPGFDASIQTPPIYLGGDPMLDTQPMPMPDPRAGARMAYNAPIGPMLPEQGTALDLSGIDPLDPLGPTTPSPTPTPTPTTSAPSKQRLPWVPLMVGLGAFAILRTLT